MDNSFKVNNTFSLSHFYMRSLVSSRRKNPLPTIIMAVGILCFVLGPLLAIRNTRIEIYASISLGGMLVAIITSYLYSYLTKIENQLDCCFIVEYAMTNNDTGESKPMYVYVDGGYYLSSGTASVAMLARREGIMTPKAQAKENIRVGMVVEKKQSENARDFSELIHDEQFQQDVAKAILEKGNEWNDLIFTYFTEYKPKNRKFKGRFYEIPGERGLYERIFVPIDCGFGKR